MAAIAIDGRKYFDYGIGTYVQQLIKSLSALQTKHQFVLFVHPEEKNRILLPNSWRTADADYGKYSLGEFFFFGFESNRKGVDVFHAPHYTLPIGLHGRSIVTVHDIIHLRFPDYYGLPQRMYSYAMIWHALKHSRFVSTDSEFTKRDILKTFRIPEDKIRVIPLGVGEQYRPVKGKKFFRDFRERLGIPMPYVLYVGNIMPHKGIPVLLEAFKQIVSPADLDLVIVGGSLLQDPALRQRAADLEILSRVRNLGRLSDDDLVLAYNAAEVLVMPSAYEGFGLPALEAMACNTPVIVSDAASLPEIVGSAAMIFKAGDSTELAEALRTVLKEPSVRRDLSQKGRNHARTYTWARTARETLALYDQIADD